jgi:hypothetical protein
VTLVVIREVLQRGIVTIRFKWIKLKPVIRDGKKIKIRIRDENTGFLG